MQGSLGTPPELSICTKHTLPALTYVASFIGLVRGLANNQNNMVRGRDQRHEQSNSLSEMSSKGWGVEGLSPADGTTGRLEVRETKRQDLVEGERPLGQAFETYTEGLAMVTEAGRSLSSGSAWSTE